MLLTYENIPWAKRYQSFMKAKRLFIVDTMQGVILKSYQEVLSLPRIEGSRNSLTEMSPMALSKDVRLSSYQSSLTT